MLYYMFLARDTGAQHYFSVPLVRAWQIFRGAYQQVSGLARTVRGPSMSAGPCRIQILGVADAGGKKLITMRFLQGRNPDWVQRPFFAEYDESANWIDDLKPAFGEQKFFFEDEMERMIALIGTTALLTTLSSKKAADAAFSRFTWSGREDSNLRPPAPHAGTLPGCATPRRRGL